jgi:hypothetical protein
VPEIVERANNQYPAARIESLGLKFIQGYRTAEPVNPIKEAITRTSKLAFATFVSATGVF